VTFPNGDNVIQFRNEFDRNNLLTAVQSAMYLVIGGSGYTIVP
jgi:hypothetical protein